MAVNTEKIKQQVAETLELPKDVIMDAPKVTVVGNAQLSIENHRGIIQYDNTNIRINTNIGIFRISGTDLIIKNIVAEEIVISGKIDNIDISD